MAKILNLLSNAGGSSTTNFPLLDIKNTNADEFSGEIKFLKDGSSQNAQLGLISFYGDDSLGNETLFSQITAKPANIDDATEHGKIEFDVAAAGTSTTGVKIEGGGATPATAFVNVTAIGGGAGTFAVGVSQLTVNAANGNTAVAGTLDVGATLDVVGIVNVNNTTTSTTSTSGALIVDGGVGIAENCHVGGTLDTTGVVNLNNTTTSTTSTSGALIVDGGVGIAENCHVGGNATVGGTLAVTGATTFGSGDDAFTFPTVKGDEAQILRLADGDGDVAWSNLLLDDLGDVKYDTAVGSLYVGSEPGSSGANSKYNVSLGFEALKDVAGTATDNEGDRNTCIGYKAGAAGALAITTGSNLTCIGYNCDPSSATAINEISLGDANVDAIRCASQSLITLSDGRDKKDVVNSSYGLDFVESLRPVQYTWDKRVLTEADANFSKNGKKQIGFIAQELQSACGESGNEILDLVYESNPERLEVRYGNLIPILTKAIQELKSENNALSERLSALENAH